MSRGHERSEGLRCTRSMRGQVMLGRSQNRALMRGGRA